MKRYNLKQRNTSKQPFFARRKEKKSKRRLIFGIIIILALTYSMLTWLMPTLIGSLTVINKFKETPLKPTPIAEQVTLAPPVLSIPFEATNSSTIKIKGYATPNLSVEIYVDDELKSTTTTSEDGSFVSDEIFLNLGNNNIYGQTADDNNHHSLSSKTIRVIYNNEKPELEVSSPTDNQEIKGGDKKVTISGKVTPTEGVSTTINGTRAILKDNGSFSQTMDISEGENNIIVIATNQTGSSTQITRKVIYIP